MIIGVCIFFSFAFGSIVSIMLHENFEGDDPGFILTDDLVFPYYDYVLRLYIPGLWYPYKEQFCKDFEEVEGIGDSFICQENFEINSVMFKTNNGEYYWSKNWQFQFYNCTLEEEKPEFTESLPDCICTPEMSPEIELCRLPCTEWQDPEFHGCVLPCLKGRGGDCYNDGTYRYGLEGEIQVEDDDKEGDNDDPPTDPTADDKGNSNSDL